MDTDKTCWIGSLANWQCDKGFNGSLSEHPFHSGARGNVATLILTCKCALFAAMVIHNLIVMDIDIEIFLVQ